MTEKEVIEWFKGVVPDVFMNFLYYDRKNCEYIHYSELREFMDNGVISEEMMVEEFTKQIKEEYKKTKQNGTIKTIQQA